MVSETCVPQGTGCMIQVCTARIQRTGCAEAHWVVDQLQLLGKAIGLVQDNPAQQMHVG